MDSMVFSIHFRQRSSRERPRPRCRAWRAGSTGAAARGVRNAWEAPQVTAKNMENHALDHEISIEYVMIMDIIGIIVVLPVRTLPDKSGN